MCDSFQALSLQCEKIPLTLSCLSVWNKWASTGQIFMRFDIRVFFESLSWKLKFHYNRTRMLGTLYEDQHTFLSYLAQFFLKWDMFQTKVVDKIKTYMLRSITCFLKWCLLWDNVETYGRTGQATEDNMAHAYCMLGDQGYRHTLRICNTYCFSAATIVARKQVSFTL
jgi:hypothetical protein